MGNKTDLRTSRMLHGFEIIAAWQFAAFIVLLLLIWINEIFNLAAMVYGTEQHEPNYFSAVLLSAFVIIMAIVIVGQTYMKQKQIISGMLTVCMKCHKVRLDDEVWQRIENYLSDRHPVEFSHGYCPDCFEEEMDIVNSTVRKCECEKV